MFSPTDWDKWTPDEEVSAEVVGASPGQTLQLVKALQRVQRLEGTELSFADLNLHSLDPLLEVQVLPQHLTSLSLRGNPWTDPTALSSQLQPLQQLTSLDLSCCTLALDNLQLLLPSLPRLRVLRLDKNALRSTEGIARCPKLTEVYLAHNQLVCTEHLEMLLELRILDLAQNSLTSIQRSLRPLTACPNLGQLKLQGNPLAKVDVTGTLRSLFPALELLDDRPLRRRKPGVGVPPETAEKPGVRPQSPAPPTGTMVTYAGKTRSYARPTKSSMTRVGSRLAGAEMEDLTPVPAASTGPAPRYRRATRTPLVPRGSFTPQPRRTQVVAQGASLQRSSAPVAASPVQQSGIAPLERTSPDMPSTVDHAAAEHLRHCRHLIEEKRRLLQRITSKLGEGVAKTSFTTSGPGGLQQPLKSQRND